MSRVTKTLRNSLCSFCLCIVFLGCQSGGASTVRVVETDGFRFNFEYSGLNDKEIQDLIDEARRSKSSLERGFGAYLRKGDFVIAPSSAFAPPPDNQSPSKKRFSTASIPVRVSQTQTRSYADASGLTLARRGLANHDMTHELVHFMFGASWNPIDEGLAVFLTESLRGSAGGYDLDTRSLVYSKLGKLKSLNHQRIEKEGMTRVDYDAAGSFVSWLIRQFGLKKFFQLYRGPANNYQWVYGKSEIELYDAWLRSIDTYERRDSRNFYRFRAFLTVGLQEAR